MRENRWGRRRGGGGGGFSRLSGPSYMCTVHPASTDVGCAMVMVMVAPLLGLFVVSGSPASKSASVFEGEATSLIKFPEAGASSQVHYFKPGERQFHITCPPSSRANAAATRAFFEVHVPGANTGVARALRFTSSSLAHLTVAEPHVRQDSDGAHSYLIDGCPFKRERLAWEGVELETVVQYGATECSTGGEMLNFSIGSAGPYAVTVGDMRNKPFTDYLMAPITYERAGAWAGWSSPWLAIAIAAKAAVIIKAVSRDSVHWDTVVHGWIIATLLIFMIAEEVRVSGIMRYSLSRTCPMPATGKSEGPVHSDHNSDSANELSAWVATGRLALYLFLISLMVSHHHSRRMGTATLAAAVFAAMLSWAFSVAGGVFAVLVVLYVIAESAMRNGQGSQNGMYFNVMYAKV